MQFALRQTGFQLQHLYCDWQNGDTATYNYLNPGLKELYNRLRNSREQINLNPNAAFLTIYLLDVQPDLTVPFDSSEFNKNISNRFLFLIHLRTKKRRVSSPCLQVTKVGFLKRIGDLNHKRMTRFLSLYPNIRIIHIRSIENSPYIPEKRFLQFLRSLNSLVELDLRRAMISDNFYTRLSVAKHANGQAVVDTLNTLTILERAESNERKFKFLVKFPRLRYLRVNQASREEMIRLLKDAQRCWQVFEFRFDFMWSKFEPNRQFQEEDFYRWAVRKQTELQFFEPNVFYEVAFEEHDLRYAPQPMIVPKKHRFVMFDDVLDFIDGKHKLLSKFS